MAKEIKKTDIYWIIGEATNCGKTTIASSLIRVLNGLGKITIGFKPFAGIRFSQSRDLLINEIPFSDCGMFGSDALKLCDASPHSDRGMLDIINPSLLLFKDSILEPLLIRIGSKKLNNLVYYGGEFLEGFLKDDGNKQIFKHIRESLNVANVGLGTERGEAPDAAGTGLRFSHLMAIAPNASSSIIMGNTSPSIEPYRANAYRQDTLSGSSLNKNKFLDKFIKEACDANKKLDYQEIWSSIIANDGSVQHLEFLDEWTKDVFKTSMEIDQRWIVDHAAHRQNYIDQAQSLNLFFRPDVNVKYLHAVHFQAWKQGLKTLYYCRSEKIGKADKVSKKIQREIIEEIDLKALATEEVCLACEG